jgi:hypothetical protein
MENLLFARVLDMHDLDERLVAQLQTVGPGLAPMVADEFSRVLLVMMFHLPVMIIPVC